MLLALVDKITEEWDASHTINALGLIINFHLESDGIVNWNMLQKNTVDIEPGSRTRLFPRVYPVPPIA